MFYTRCRLCPTKMLASAVLACGAAVWISAGTAAAADGAAAFEPRCSGNACVVIEYEETVAREAAELADALRIRLKPLGVRVVAEEYAESGGAATPAEGDREKPALFWIVHLRRLSSELILVAIDNLIGAGTEDVVREVARGETEEATIWTISLMIEETVAPYFEEGEDQPAVGAGLAIIEPPAVGGIAKPDVAPPQAFPKLHLVGLGLVVTGIVTTGDFAVGPVVAVEGLFAPRFLVAFSVGWAGYAEYSRGDLVGRVQYIPMEIGLAYRIYASRAVELTAWTGLAVGFAVYRTETKSGSAPSRTDVLFEPGVLAALRLSFTVYGPLACYLVGGAAVPLVRDVLENRRVTIYEAGWVAPDIEVGAQVKF